MALTGKLTKKLVDHLGAGRHGDGVWRGTSFWTEWLWRGTSFWTEWRQLLDENFCGR